MASATNGWNSLPHGVVDPSERAFDFGLVGVADLDGHLDVHDADWPAERLIQKDRRLARDPDLAVVEQSQRLADHGCTQRLDGAVGNDQRRHRDPAAAGSGSHIFRAQQRPQHVKRGVVVVPVAVIVGEPGSEGEQRLAEAQRLVMLVAPKLGDRMRMGWVGLGPSSRASARPSSHSSGPPRRITLVSRRCCAASRQGRRRPAAAGLLADELQRLTRLVDCDGLDGCQPEHPSPSLASVCARCRHTPSSNVLAPVSPSFSLQSILPRFTSRFVSRTGAPPPKPARRTEKAGRCRRGSSAR